VYSAKICSKSNGCTILKSMSMFTAISIVNEIGSGIDDNHSRMFHSVCSLSDHVSRVTFVMILCFSIEFVILLLEQTANFTSIPTPVFACINHHLPNHNFQAKHVFITEHGAIRHLREPAAEDR